jgi:hypothetical protein
VVTGIDDHSRFLVCCRVVARATGRAVSTAFAEALRRYGVPAEVLTDNGKQFTGRFGGPRAGEVLFDRICRENGIEHLLTQPRSPTTTGKIERFHRTLRTEFDTARVFDSLQSAQAELDAWVEHYNTERPHQSLDDATPASRFLTGTDVAEPVRTRPVLTGQRRVDKPGEQWVSRKVGGNGVVCVGWQQVSVGKHHGGRRCDVLVTAKLLQFWVDDELLKTVARTSTGEIRKKRAQGSTPRS